MEYFCYISRTKVDQLFQNISSDVDEWIEKRVTEQDLGAEVSADFSIGRILNLFKGGITYGRKGIIQREKKVKLHYVEKLRKVLLAIAKERRVPSLEQAIKTSVFDSIYWHHTGHFGITTPISAYDPSKINSNKIITLSSEVLSHQLHLDCSLRFFSDGNEPDGTFLLHSSNSRFFTGGIGLQLETIFVLLNHEGHNLFGTPLFLKLTSDAANPGISL